MQAFEIDTHILHTIFIEPNQINQSIIKEIVDWNAQLDPSFSLVKSVLNHFFVAKNQQGNVDLDLLRKSTQDVPSLLIKLQKFKCPKNFIRAFLAIIKTNEKKLEKFIDMKNIIKNWKIINCDIIQFYTEAFNLQIEGMPFEKEKENNPIKKFLIPKQEVDERVETLIILKQYDKAIIIIKLANYNPPYLELLFERMGNSKQASKAAKIIKNHKLNPDDFPQIGERLNKNMARYFLKSYGWEYAEEIFQDHLQGLACVVEDLVFKGKQKEAIGIFLRNQNVKKFITKKETLEFFEKSQKQVSFKQNIVENYLFKDYFGNSDSQKYLTLQEFGIKRQQVIWLDQKMQSQIKDFVMLLNSSQLIGVDTESTVGQTKLDKKKSQTESASLIQIAFKDKIYLLDGDRCNNKQIRNAFLQFFKANKMVLGHALENDIGSLLKSIGIKEKQIPMIKIDNVVDTWKLFKTIYPNQRYSNLAYICLKVFGKQICKKQTLTNWKRRPLRQNQLYYASMDAYICVKLFLKFKEELGEQVINYYANIEF